MLLSETKYRGTRRVRFVGSPERKRLLDSVCRVFNVSEDELKSGKIEFSLARFALSFVAHYHLKMPFTDIAEMINRKKTNTRSHIKHAEQRLKFSHSFRVKVGSVIDDVSQSEIDFNG